MTEEKLNEALEMKGKAAEAEQQAIGLRTMLENVINNQVPEKPLYFQFKPSSPFAIPILKGLIEVFENQKDRYELEFSKL